MKQLRILFGGTFDPPHMGHINPAVEAANLLQLDEIHLLPNKIPVHKTRPTVAQAHRLKMLELVSISFPIFKIETHELTSTGKSYTVTTIQELKQRDADLIYIFMMGHDSWIQIHQWHEYETLLDLCHFVVLNRKLSVAKIQAYQNVTHSHGLPVFHISPSNTNDLPKVHDAWNKHLSSVTFCDTEFEDVSSTQIREQLDCGMTPSALSREVADYISKFKLYAQVKT